MYGSGQSPLREALMRLASEQLVVLEDHKGFRVAPVSADEALDIAKSRCELEGLAVRMAIENGDDRWEANIIARFHELSKRATYTSDGKLDPEWERRHDAFHQALYAGCELRSLMSFARFLPTAHIAIGICCSKASIARAIISGARSHSEGHRQSGRERRHTPAATLSANRGNAGCKLEGRPYLGVDSEPSVSPLSLVPFPFFL